MVGTRCGLLFPLIGLGTLIAIAAAADPMRLAERPDSRRDPAAGPGGRAVGDALNLSRLGRWADGTSSAILVVGDLAFHGRGGIVEIIPVGGEKADVPALGRVELPSKAWRLAYRDGLLYVAGYNAGLWVIDVGEPTAPEVVGHLALDGVACGVTLHGDHAYVACDTPGFAVVDIHDPTQPSLAAMVFPGSDVRDVAAAGDVLAVASGYRLRLYDISTPASPLLVASESVSDVVNDVEIREHVVYVAGFAAGLRIYDVSDPRHPVLSAAMPLHPWVTGIAVNGTLACATSTVLGFYLIDVSDPADPGFVSYVEIESGDQYDAVIDDDQRLIYLANGALGLEVYDALDPSAPTLAYRRATSGRMLGLDVDGDRVAAACTFAGLLLVDAGAPAALVGQGTWTSRHTAWSVDLDGNRAVVSQDFAGFALIDVSDPTAPREVGRFQGDPFGQALHARCRGAIAYLADGSMGDFQTIDIGDLANPVPLGRLEGDDIAFAVDLKGDVACVANGYEGCLLVDVADPAVPKRIACVDTPGEAVGVSIGGEYAFVADRGGGLRVIAIGDPDGATEVGHLQVGAGVEAVAAELPYVYLACGAAGVRLVDASDPAVPVEVGFFQTGEIADDVAVREGLVYVAERENGFWILQNDLIGTPVLLSAFTATRTPGGCRVAWQTAPGATAVSFAVWRAHRDGARRVVATVPRDPAGRYDLLDAGAPAGELRYWLEARDRDGQTDWFGPVLAAGPAPGGATVSLACRPNPFNAATVLSFDVPTAGRARLEIVDLRGRRLVTLRDEELAAGTHTATWDGRDTAGHAVAAGTYLARLAGEGFVRSLKIAIVE